VLVAGPERVDRLREPPAERIEMAARPHRERWPVRESASPSAAIKRVDALGGERAVEGADMLLRQRPRLESRRRRETARAPSRSAPPESGRACLRGSAAAGRTAPR